MGQLKKKIRNAICLQSQSSQRVCVKISGEPDAVLQMHVTEAEPPATKSPSPLSSLSSSPFQARGAGCGTAPSPGPSETSVVRTRAQEQGLAINPLFERERPYLQQQERPGGPAVPSLQAQSRDSGGGMQRDQTSDAERGVGVLEPNECSRCLAHCEEPAMLQQYLGLLSTLTAKLAENEAAASNTLDSGSLPPLDTSNSEVLQQRATAAEQHLVALCSRLARQAKSLGCQTPSAPKREGASSFDIMRSISGSCADTTCSEPISPSISGMATLCNAVALLLEGHRKQAKAFERYMGWSGARCEAGSAGANDPAVPTAPISLIRKRLGDMEGTAELVKSELQKLRELSSQQELEVAIQWQEKQDVQQQAHDKQASALQVCT
jgi:hypothetical protein